MNSAKDGDGLLGGSPTSGMLAGSTGLEPAASGVTGRRSNQLNYDPKDDLKLIYATRDADFRLSGTSNVSDCRTQFQLGIASNQGIFNLHLSRSRRMTSVCCVVGGTGLEPVTAGV